MPNSVLVAYATRYGSTREVAEAISAALRENGAAADIKPVREVRTLTGYDSIVLGAPLLMFHWHKDALRFLLQHQKALVEKKVTLFVLGPTHVPHDGKEWQDSRSQLDKELLNYQWFRPAEIKVFGGKYDPSKLSFPINMFAGKVPASDIRDWTEIRSWAKGLAAKLKSI